jgi:hypothetical protein
MPVKLLARKWKNDLIEVKVGVDDGGPILEKINAPVCGSCQLYHDSRCTKAGQVKPARSAAETGCTEHRYFGSFLRLSDHADELRRTPHNPGILQLLNEEFSEVPEQEAYFADLKAGKRPPVSLWTDKPTGSSPRVLRVNGGPFGEQIGISWPNAAESKNEITYKPMIELASEA